MENGGWKGSSRGRFLHSNNKSCEECGGRRRHDRAGFLLMRQGTEFSFAWNFRCWPRSGFKVTDCDLKRRSSSDVTSVATMHGNSATQSLGKACCKLGTSWVLGRDSGVAIVFSSYFLRILFVFSWCFAFVLPRGLLSRRPLISACCNLLTVEPTHCHRRASRAREGRRSAWPRFPSARSFL